MITTISNLHDHNSLKPIKQIKLKTFKQIYQKQTSKTNLDLNLQPRKSFLNVTRRYSTIGCPYSAASQQPQLAKNLFLKKRSQFHSSLQREQISIDLKKGKQNITVNRIPIKIKSKKLSSKNEKIKKQKSLNSDSFRNYKYSQKLLQSPFNDDFICIERQFAINEDQQQNEEYFD